jgi:hypothetical protein
MYHDDTGIIFSSIKIPSGCIAETALFREKRVVPQGLPWFMKYVTGGYVSEPEAGQLLRLLTTQSAASRVSTGAGMVVPRRVWDPKEGQTKGAGSGGEISRTTN